MDKQQINETPERKTMIEQKSFSLLLGLLLLLWLLFFLLVLLWLLVLLFGWHNYEEWGYHPPARKRGGTQKLWRLDFAKSVFKTNQIFGDENQKMSSGGLNCRSCSGHRQIVE